MDARLLKPYIVMLTILLHEIISTQLVHLSNYEVKLSSCLAALSMKQKLFEEIWKYLSAKKKITNSFTVAPVSPLPVFDSSLSIPLRRNSNINVKLYIKYFEPIKKKKKREKRVKLSHKLGCELNYKRPTVKIVFFLISDHKRK